MARLREAREAVAFVALRAVLFLVFLGVLVSSWLELRNNITKAQRPAESAGAQTESVLSFKITFGLKQKLHGRVWTGVLRNPAQVRSPRGWHLDAGDSITPPDRWNLSLRTVTGDTPSKAVILDVLSPPEQPVVIYTREGDISFTPARVPYGVIHYIPESSGDISVERVPVPQIVSSDEFEDDDPALLRTRGGEYWMAWVASKTISRSGDYTDGGDQIFVARSRDARTWPANLQSKPLTQPGDHFRVALAEDGRGLIWCVYSRPRQIESGNFDLYARVFDGTDWSAEQQLTSDPRPDVFQDCVGPRRQSVPCLDGVPSVFRRRGAE